MELPKDPAILLSFINTKLRDDYPNLDALCEDLHIRREELEETMRKNGFEYSEENNK
ncbi:MAG: DUF4250 domain-containing protein, partial [Muribaculaceae bacterium]|nr:DUF4250 domain-containing protein [Muribaculaceae bacterium]